VSHRRRKERGSAQIVTDQNRSGPDESDLALVRAPGEAATAGSRSLNDVLRQLCDSIRFDRTTGATQVGRPATRGQSHCHTRPTVPALFSCLARPLSFATIATFCKPCLSPRPRTGAYRRSQRAQRGPAATIESQVEIENVSLRPTTGINPVARAVLAVAVVP
jgi:hypothetical protein